MANTNNNEYNPDYMSHAGTVLREKLQEMQMSSKEFAIRVDKPEETISKILNGKSSITTEMAVLFESATKIPARFWINRQRLYDEHLTRKKREVELAAAEEWAIKFPYAEMAAKGWVEKTRNRTEKVANLLKYFGVSSRNAWENLYLNGELKASFRISLAHAQSPEALSAWLRRGDIQAENIDAPAYSVTNFKKSLPALKTIMAKQPDNFFLQAQEICRSAGVKIVYTPCLPKAPINGVARWINNNTVPLIQLSCRQKRNDIFWFSFFHEIGHILLHGKKDVFLENISYADKDEEKEKEADEFAVSWTFSKAEEAEFTAQIERGMNGTELAAYAKKIGTHPGIIIGRMRHLNILPQHTGTEFLVKIDTNVIS